MSIDYRVAQPDDLEALVELVEPYALDQQRLLPINTLAPHYMSFARAGLEQAIEHPAGCVMVAVDTSDERLRLAGYAIGMVQEPPAIFEPELYTFVSDLYVKPEYRRQGIATGLVERVRGWGWMKGVTRLSLILPNNNEAAFRLYQKLGFKPIQTMLYYKEDQQ